MYDSEDDMKYRLIGRCLRTDLCFFTLNQLLGTRPVLLPSRD